MLIFLVPIPHRVNMKSLNLKGGYYMYTVPPTGEYIFILYFQYHPSGTS